MFEENNTTIKENFQQEKINEIFSDAESRRNIVGLFDLLLKIDRRINPRFYKPENKVENIEDNKNEKA